MLDSSAERLMYTEKNLDLIAHSLFKYWNMVKKYIYLSS